MTLEEYLKKDKNSVFREKLVNYKIFYEIKLAAARNKSDINIYIPEIDRDGYDLLLHDKDKIKPFQLKSKIYNSKTSNWLLQKQLLRPFSINVNLLDYEASSISDEGFEGGLILINIKISKEKIEDLNYYYTDCFIISALEKELIKFKNKNTQKSTFQIIKELKKGNRYEKIKITKSIMVEVETVEHLLALSGISSIFQNNWQNDYKNYLINSNPINKKNNNKTFELRASLILKLNKIIKDKRLKIE